MVKLAMTLQDYNCHEELPLSSKPATVLTEGTEPPSYNSAKLSTLPLTEPAAHNAYRAQTWVVNPMPIHADNQLKRVRERRGGGVRITTICVRSRSRAITATAPLALLLKHFCLSANPRVFPLSSTLSSIGQTQLSGLGRDNNSRMFLHV
ncbi:hypothetical protein J6590_053977 [Homalodisca vitripennis]|nr:hypothetical protein J6590_053977 [Homalodisca vitripennis]